MWALEVLKKEGGRTAWEVWLRDDDFTVVLLRALTVMENTPWRARVRLGDALYAGNTLEELALAC